MSAAIVITLLFMFSSVAAARLNGEASLTYSSYKGNDSTFSKSSNALSQNYSILYSSSGPIYNSRVGNYNVALGYNWTALDSTFKYSAEPTESYKENRGKVLFLGEFKLDPKEVPFKLNAYSRDMVRNTVVTSGGIGAQPFLSMIGGNNQVADINNGLHLETGVTLIAGVKNGMTNGYNEILRHFPMILIDFKDTINQDLHSLTPVDDRLSRLAFVSLNKKDNWFHYRHTQYVNNINKSDNYEENQLQLGTVDQYMARRWIDFSNWIKVSTDLQLSTRKNIVPPNQTEEIDLNLFVTAERKSWNARTFSTFNRYVDEVKNLKYMTLLPVYLSGTVDNDLSWSARTLYRDSRNIDASSVASGYTNMLLGYRVNAFRRAQFSLSQSFDVESSSSDSSDLLTLSGVLETASTPRFSRTVRLGASYNIRNSSTSTTSRAANSEITSVNSDFLLQHINLDAGYTPNNTLRIDFKQANNFTHGKNASFGGQTQLSAFSSATTTSTDVGSKSYQSVSTFSVAWNPKPRLHINFVLSEDISKSDVHVQIAETLARSSITFTNARWDVKNNLDYVSNNKSTNNNVVTTVSNASSLRYNHSRNLNASATATYSNTNLMGDNSSGTSFGQALNYSYFNSSGIDRKLFEINETFTYSVGKPKSANPSKNAATLGFRYYPISRFTLAGGVSVSEFRFSDPFNDSLIWNASAVANFKLLQASVDYVSAFRNTDKVRERKITGNIRKAF